MRDVTILGAGLAGSLLATFLGQRGYRVTMFEKRPDLRKDHIPAGRSINLALAERGFHALRMAKLEPQVRNLLIPMRGRMLHDLAGKQTFVPYGQRPHELIYSVSRRFLNRLLLDAAESTGQVDLRFRSECLRVDLPKQQIMIRDGETGQDSMREFDLLLGADGASSVLREAILAETSGVATYEPLDHAYKELTIAAGPRETFQIEREALHIWPRGDFMLIALPNLGGSFTATLFLPVKGDPGFETLVDPERVQAFFATHFPDAMPWLPDLQRDYFANPTGTLGTLRCWPWTFQDVALVLGDAAHAIVPFHGQGMNAAFEDCAELVQLVAQHDHHWDEVLPAFAGRRKPNADAIATMALENYLDMRDTVRRPDFVPRKELGFELERRFPSRFVPRYSLVMFHRTPYSEALQRGFVQERILDQLLEDLVTRNRPFHSDTPCGVAPGAAPSASVSPEGFALESIDYGLAERLVHTLAELPPMTDPWAG